MSNQFDIIDKQFSEVLNSIKDLKEENKCQKEINCKLNFDIRSKLKK